MKKIYTIVVMLIVLLPQVIYAYGVKEVNDFKNIPNISNRKNFYIVKNTYSTDLWNLNYIRN